MSLTVSSDLVLDVMKAAPPQRLEAAIMKLAGHSGDVAASRTDFAKALNNTKIPEPTKAQGKGDLVADVMSAVNPEEIARAEARLAGLADKPAPAYRQFEAFLLRNAFESMLPPADGGAYGKGLAGDMWRSMAADQLATTLAESGGIGVARILATSESGRTEGLLKSPQWPYFQRTSISAFESLAMTDGNGLGTSPVDG